MIHGSVNMFGSWTSNNFIYGPVVSSLVVPISPTPTNDQQLMIDRAGIALTDVPDSYYPRCWTIIAILTINGAIEDAAKLVTSGTSPGATPTAAPTVAPIPDPTAAPTGAPVPDPTAAPTTPPTASPTTAPVPNPTAAPVLSPTDDPFPCCSWDGQVCTNLNDAFCQADQANCEGPCNGFYLTTAPPTPVPEYGCCVWNDTLQSCDGQPTNDFCDAEQGNCEVNCSGRWIPK